MRLYGFSKDEVISRTSPWLDLEIDPKQAFAGRHPELFPVDINTADREMILRVPGIGLKTANRIVGLRKKGRLRFEHLRQLGAVVSRAHPFIRCDGMETAQWTGAAPSRRSHGARTADARHYGQAVQRNVEIQVFQVVLHGEHQGFVQRKI